MDLPDEPTSKHPEDTGRVQELLNRFRDQKITRRQLLKGLAASGVSLAALASSFTDPMVEESRAQAETELVFWHQESVPHRVQSF